MSDISFGKRYSRGFQKFLDGFHLAAGAAAVILLLAVMISDNPMKLYPFVFLDAAALNLVCAYAGMKTSYRRRHERSAGVGFLFLGILMLVLAILVGICVW